jgi:hypothetical protein
MADDPLPPEPKSTSQAETWQGMWDYITDHPKVAGVLALLAFAATFSPKASTVAAWLCIVAAWALALLWMAGIPAIKAQRKSWIPVVVAALVLGAGMFLYGK